MNCVDNLVHAKSTREREREVGEREEGKRKKKGERGAVVSIEFRYSTERLQVRMNNIPPVTDSKVLLLDQYRW